MPEAQLSLIKPGQTVEISAADGSAIKGRVRTVAPTVQSRLLLGGAADGWENYEDVVGSFPGDPVADEGEGEFMLYSSHDRAPQGDQA